MRKPYKQATINTGRGRDNNRIYRKRLGFPYCFFIYLHKTWNVENSKQGFQEEKEALSDDVFFIYKI